MKFKHTMQAICLAMLAACALSCDKNDDGPAQPLLSEVIYNSYWDIKYQFVYEENGKTEVSGDVQSYHYDELHLVGGEYTKPFIDVIHVGSPSDNSFECYKKAQIKFDDNLVWRQHYQFQQRLPAPIIIDDKARTVTIDTFGAPNLTQENVIFGLDMHAVEVSEERIVFDAPIKEYIAYLYGFDYYFSGKYVYPDRETGEEVVRPRRTHKALRVTWTRNQHPEYFAGLEPQE